MRDRFAVSADFGGKHDMCVAHLVCSRSSEFICPAKGEVNVLEGSWKEVVQRAPFRRPTASHPEGSRRLGSRAAYLRRAYSHKPARAASALAVSRRVGLVTPYLRTKRDVRLLAGRYVIRDHHVSPAPPPHPAARPRRRPPAAALGNSIHGSGRLTPLRRPSLSLAHDTSRSQRVHCDLLLLDGTRSRLTQTRSLYGRAHRLPCAASIPSRSGPAPGYDKT